MDAKEEARIDMEGQRPAHPVLLRESERSVTLAIIAGKTTSGPLARSERWTGECAALSAALSAALRHEAGRAARVLGLGFGRSSRGVAARWSPKLTCLGPVSFLQRFSGCFSGCFSSSGQGTLGCLGSSQPIRPGASLAGRYPPPPACRRQPCNPIYAIPSVQTSTTHHTPHTTHRTSLAELPSATSSYL